MSFIGIKEEYDIVTGRPTVRGSALFTRNMLSTGDIKQDHEILECDILTLIQNTLDKEYANKQHDSGLYLETSDDIIYPIHFSHRMPPNILLMSYGTVHNLRLKVRYNPGYIKYRVYERD